MCFLNLQPSTFKPCGFCALRLSIRTYFQIFREQFLSLHPDATGATKVISVGVNSLLLSRLLNLNKTHGTCQVFFLRRRNYFFAKEFSSSAQFLFQLFKDFSEPLFLVIRSEHLKYSKNFFSMQVFFKNSFCRRKTTSRSKKKRPPQGGPSSKNSPFISIRPWALSDARFSSTSDFQTGA